MTSYYNLLVRFFALCMALVPGLAHADCDELRTMPQGAYASYNAADIQAGLRAVTGDLNARLNDEKMGSYTKDALAKLCADLDRPVTFDAIPFTLNAAAEYARVTTQEADWHTILLSPAFRKALTGEPEKQQNTMALRLAGPPRMTASVLGNPTSVFHCSGAISATKDEEDLGPARDAFIKVFRVHGPTQICKSLPITGTQADFLAAMKRFNRIEIALPGAIVDLSTPEFATWLSRAPDSILLRLVGPEKAVIEVVREYRRQTKGKTPPPKKDNPCERNPAKTTLTYFSLTQKKIDELETSLDLTTTFDAFREAHPTNPSADKLWEALSAKLSVTLEDCILPGIKEIVLNDMKLGLTYQLDPMDTANLITVPEIQDVIPVIEEFTESRAPTHKVLADGIRAKLKTAIKVEVDAEIELAAELLAAAAEPVEPLYDTAIPNIEFPEETPPAPTAGVTDSTDFAISQTLTNEKFKKALLSNNYLPATVPELLKADVRGILRPIGEIIVTDKVNADMKMIEPAIRPNWSLTRELQKKILEIDYIAEAIADKTGEDFKKRMKPMSGIIYPSNRLFQAALKEIKPNYAGKDGEPFSQFLVSRITNTATVNVPHEAKPRLSGPMAKPGCGCVPTRTPKTEIYGFYPFWLAPLAKAIPAPDPEDPAKAEAERPTNPPRALVDFSVISHLIFYGLEFDIEPNEDPNQQKVILRNEERWTEAKRDFVNSAHRHRAKVDLSFDLYKWRQWNKTNIESVAANISAQMAPFGQLIKGDFGTIPQAIPTLFDTHQADGLTLIFHGFEGNVEDDEAKNEQMKTLLSIIRKVYQSLPNRADLKINVAFDFELVADNLDEPLFDELFELMQSEKIVVQEQALDVNGAIIPGKIKETTRVTAKVVHRILLFLERPTSDKKKGLRFRMEQGLFQGESRSKALKSIVAIVPPSAHRYVRQLKKTPFASTSDSDPGTPTPQGAEFSQFKDDVVYFRDSFAGFGFWPVPDIADTTETPSIFKIIKQHFVSETYIRFVPFIDEPSGAICTFVCPNRAYIALFAMALFGTIVVLTWRSFYSGRADNIAFRSLTFGCVWIGSFVLLATLTLMKTCDLASEYPLILLAAFAGFLILMKIANVIQRGKNGPKP